MTRFLRQTWTIAAKDLRTELRNKEALSAALSFTLVVILLFSFAFDPVSNVEVRDLSGGLLWIAYIFAGILLLNRSFARESANDCLDALVASPLSGGALFLGKAVIGTLFSAVTANNRLRELMLPLLVFPMTLPALIACVQLTTVILTGDPLGDSVAWLKLLFGFDVIFTLLGAVLLESVLLA